MANSYGLVIFDCDGVLIDSEILSGSVMVDELARLGITIDISVFFSRMVGRSFEQAMATVHELTGKSVPSGFKDSFRLSLLARFEHDLKPIAGIVDLLSSLRVPVCVATSSDPLRAARSLEVTGLSRFFTDRVFTASMVPNGKPAPDLFLHAAQVMSVEPARAIVIEDSAFGLMAAKAAGMTAWHFTGGGHFKGGYQVASEIMRDQSFSNMADLLTAARQLRIA